LFFLRYFDIAEDGPWKKGRNIHYNLFEKCLEKFPIVLLVFGVCLGEGLRRRIFPWRNFSWENRNSFKGAQDFLALFKRKTMRK